MCAFSYSATTYLGPSILHYQRMDGHYIRTLAKNVDCCGHSKSGVVEEGIEDMAVTCGGDPVPRAELQD